jgi:dipeptidase
MTGMNRIIHFLLALALVSFPARAGTTVPGDESECFTIVVGRAASADGSVLVAHNEDDRGLMVVSAHKLPARSHPSGATVRLRNGAELPQVPETPGLLWLEIPGQEFADAYFSEHGVVVTSNACLSREDRSDLTEGGIGFMLRRLVVERARSAAEGVRLAGELIERYGYYSSGRTYTIADPREAWMLQVVRGRRWAACRVPDDQVAVIANRYTITTLDLSKPADNLASPGLIDYAQSRGWYDPARDGSFHFARVYSDPATYAHPGNVLRQWRGTALLSSRSWREDDDLPFSFVPARKLGVPDLLKVLRDHFEGTAHDLSNRYRLGSPNRSASRTICTEATQYAFVAQLRARVAPELRTLVWICFRRPDSNGFSPWYASMPAPPAGYELQPVNDLLVDHFAPRDETELQRRDLPFAAFARLSALVDDAYAERIPDASRRWRFYEADLFKRLAMQEREFTMLIDISPTVAVRLIGNFTADCEFRKWLLAERLTRQFEP